MPIHTSQIKDLELYVKDIIGDVNALIYKGDINCSTNPNYPAADAGWTYIVSADGKIGGASGVDVEVMTMLICKVDGTPSGDQAAVGTYWTIIQRKITDYIVINSNTGNTRWRIKIDDEGSIFQEQI